MEAKKVNLNDIDFEELKREADRFDLVVSGISDTNVSTTLNDRHVYALVTAWVKLYSQIQEIPE